MARGGPNFLMTPGPTALPDRVLAAMQRPAVDLNDEALQSEVRASLADLAAIFRTAGEVFVYAANGHGGWEAALANVLSPGDLVLSPDNGVFSHAWPEMAHSLGARTELVPGDWRRGVAPERLEARLRADAAREIKAVLLVQTETSTGIQCDVAAMRAAMDAAAHPALLLVDVVASLATTDFRMDEWGVDVAVAASQKALMTPPGLAFNAVGPRAREAARHARVPRHYWDWEGRRGEEFYTWFCGTAPEHLLFALRAALDVLLEEGLEAAIARHARLAGAVRAAVAAWAGGGALDFNAALPRERADSVTTIRAADGVDADAIREACHARFDVSLGAGYRSLAGRAFRIGHMGWVNEPTVLGAVAAVQATLEACAVPHGAGAMDAAIAALAGAPVPRATPLESAAD